MRRKHRLKRDSTVHVNANYGESRLGALQPVRDAETLHARGACALQDARRAVRCFILHDLRHERSRPAPRSPGRTPRPVASARPEHDMQRSVPPPARKGNEHVSLPRRGRNASASALIMQSITAALTAACGHHEAACAPLGGRLSSSEAGHGAYVPRGDCRRRIINTSHRPQAPALQCYFAASLHGNQDPARVKMHPSPCKALSFNLFTI